MKYDVRSISEGYCHITLIPETDIERKLVIIKDVKDKEEKEYTFEVHYGNAIKYKFGPKAHLDGIEVEAYPTKVFAEYIIEPGSIGNS